MCAAEFMNYIMIIYFKYNITIYEDIEWIEKNNKLKL